MGNVIHSPSGRAKIPLPLLLILAVLSVSLAARDAGGGCCANPSYVAPGPGGNDRQLLCADYSFITAATCCPADPAYYNTTLGWYPADQAECLSAFFSDSCASLASCAPGCCYDETGTGRYTEICKSQGEGLCRLQAPGNDWAAGYPQPERYQGNPCYNLNYEKALPQCPTVTECTLFDNDEQACSTNGSCFFCPSAGPTSGAGLCFRDCAGNCLGTPADYSISNTSTGHCEQPVVAPACANTRCQLAEADCLCAPGLVTNSSHSFCCQVRDSVSDTKTGCEAACVPDCFVNASLAISRDFYAPAYSSCVCGADRLAFSLTPSPYCCGYTDVPVTNTSPCFRVGSLEGYVRAGSLTGSPISGATVSVAGQSAITDTTGHYSVPEIFIGSYTATAVADGYGPREATATISEGATTLNFVLVMAEDACTDPSQPRPDPLFSTGCVKGEAAVALSWVKKCPNIRGFHIWRNGVKIAFTLEQSYADRNLSWNTRYNYTLGVEYPYTFNDPARGQVNIANYSLIGLTGYRECAGVTTQQACLNSTFGLGGQKTVLIQCGQCNELQYRRSCAERTGNPNSVCLGPNEQGQATCLNDADCGRIGEPFGLFATAGMCAGPPETPNACYFDYSPTVVDTCYACSGISSCFSYNSEAACSADTCFVSKEPGCTYNYSNQELGKGLCVQRGYTGTDQCGLCDDPFLGCDQDTCSDLGNCYYDDGRCLACSPTSKCSDFTTEQACTGGQDFSMDPDCPAAASASGNPCGLVYCVWAGSQCIRDTDGDGQADPGIENSPPVTTILNPPWGVVGESGYLLMLNVTPPYTQTFFCVDDTDTCCPNKEIPMLDRTVNLPGGAAGTGIFHLRYFSKTYVENTVELIRSMPFYLDTEPPGITIRYVITNSTTPKLSDVRFEIETSEYATCTDRFIESNVSGAPALSSLGLNIRFSTSYRGVEDGNYAYEVTCQDMTGLSTSASVGFEADRDRLIYDAYPVGVTWAGSEMVLRVRTPDAVDCTVALLDEEGRPGAPSSMITTDRLLHQKTVSSSPSGTSFYRAVCRLGLNPYDTTSMYFTADHLAPVTTPHFNSSNRGLVALESHGWYAEDRVALVCEDARQGPPAEFGCGSTQYCTMAGSQSCVPTTLGTSYWNPGATGGVRTVCYTSTDAGGNRETAMCTAYNIDTASPGAPVLNDSSPIAGEPDFYYAGDRLRVGILSSDTESGVGRYVLSLVDSKDNPVVMWKEFVVEEGQEDGWLTVWLTTADDEWQEDAEGGKIPLVAGERYYFRGYAVDRVGRNSSVARSDGVTIVASNFTPEHCTNRIKDFDEVCIDGGGSCPACAPSTTRCGNSRVEVGEECDGANWGAVTGCEYLGFIGGSLYCRNCSFDTTDCVPETGSFCGDGTIDAGELCDDGNLGSLAACSAFDTFTSGAVSCDSSCDYDTSGCRGPNSYCGDGFIDSGEHCDGMNWGAITSCRNLDLFTGGILVCGATCRFDTGACAGGLGGACGDGVIDSGEQCDGSVWGAVTGCGDFGGFTSGEISCGSDCFFDTTMCAGGLGGECGDGVMDAGEQCDGSTYGGLRTCSDFGFTEDPDSPFYGLDLACDRCMLNTSTCPSETPTSCGDGVISSGEQCDGLNRDGISGCPDFGFTGGTLVCRADCQLDTGSCASPSGGNCGDATVDAGEQCDGSSWGSISDCTDFDRFGGGTLVCGPDCRFDTASCFGGLGGACGDGVIDSGEQCDGSVWGAITGCDDIGHFTGGTLACGNSCQFDTSRCTGEYGGKCGDGAIDAGELCDGSSWGDITGCDDFGFTGGSLGCSERCRFDTARCTGSEGGFCGDGVIDAGELCDGQTFGRVDQCIDLGSFIGGELGCSGACHFDTTGCEIPTVPCIDDIDCESLYCNPDGFCSIPTCSDSWQNGYELGVDCGGACDACTEELGACSNGVKDPDELGVDCGGACVAGCPEGTPCSSDEECSSFNCADGVCLSSSCSDGIINGGETDIDCGEVCPTRCQLDQACITNRDCVSGSCYLGKCVESVGARDKQPDDKVPKEKGGGLLRWLFILLLLIVLGIGGYFGYTRYMEAKSPAAPGMKEEPGVLRPVQPGVQQKKVELSPREQMLVSKRRRALRKEERSKAFGAFEGEGKPEAGKAEEKKPAGAEDGAEKPPAKENAEDVFSEFEGGPTGVESEKAGEEAGKETSQEKPQAEEEKPAGENPEEKEALSSAGEEKPPETEAGAEAAKDRVELEDKKAPSTAERMERLESSLKAERQAVKALKVAERISGKKGKAQAPAQLPPQAQKRGAGSKKAAQARKAPVKAAAKRKK